MMHKNSRTKYIKKTIETKELVHTVELTQDQLDMRRQSVLHMSPWFRATTSWKNS